MEGTNFQRALSECAMECALRRMNKRCRKSSNCETCDFNIQNYVDADPRHMKLFLMHAENKAAVLKGSHQNGTFIIWVIVALVVSVIALLGYTEYRAQKNFVYPQATIQQASKHDDIQSTLQKVAADLQRKVDVNKDGLSNCIDAAVLFYQYYPDKDKVCIEVNKNPEKKFHHLFNCVLIDGVWRAIEPQSGYSGYNSYYMKEVWGTKYDVKYNRDVTQDYLKYVR